MTKKNNAKKSQNPQKRHNKQFKLEAAKLVVYQGMTNAEVARRTGVTPWTIANWIKQLRASGDLIENESTQSHSDENRDLRKRVKQLELENEILKKATAYFAKGSI
jgi:transposase